MLSVDPQPQLVECNTVLAIPFRVNPENMKYCENVQVLQNIDTQGIGISSMIGDCIIKEKDYNANMSLIAVSSGSKQYFKSVDQIMCLTQGDGVYTNCSGNLEWINVEPKEYGMDVAAESVIDEDGVTGQPVSNKRIDLNLLLHMDTYIYIYMCMFISVMNTDIFV
jgi:hypothetical protein